MSSLSFGANVLKITIPLLKNCTPMFAFSELYLVKILASFEYSISSKPSFTAFSILSISVVLTGLKSWVEGP